MAKKTAPTTENAPVIDDASPNLALWNSVQATDPAYTKSFSRSGGFRGTAINHTYQQKRATEAFGPKGLGWGSTVLDEQMERGAPIVHEKHGVIGHEIGHVTARHTAQRYSAAVASQGLVTAGALILGVLTGSGQVAQAAGDLGSGVAGMALAGYSRDQEFEADTLGVRYLDRTGFDDNAMASFLGKMQEDSRLTAQIAGRNDADEFSIMQSHPRTADRVQAATAEARKQGVTSAAARVGGTEQPCDA